MTAVQVTPETNAPISILEPRTSWPEQVAIAFDVHQRGSRDGRCRHDGQLRGHEGIVPDAEDQRRHRQQRVGVRLIGWVGILRERRAEVAEPMLAVPRNDGVNRTRPWPKAQPARLRMAATRLRAYTLAPSWPISLQ